MEYNIGDITLLSLQSRQTEPEFPYCARPWALPAIFSSKMKVYLDNNIFIYLEKNRIGISDIVKLAAGPIEKIFYSASHINEALEIKGKDNIEREARLNLRLKTISEITNDNYLYQDLENSVFEQIESPFNVAQTITEIPAESIMKTFANLISEDQKKEVRRLLKLDPAKINLYEPGEVIMQLSQKLMEFGGYSFIDMIEIGISNHRDGKSFGLSNRFAAIFELLDMFGYWKDKATEKSNYARLWDSNHTFFSIFCDCFISNDWRTIKKAEVVFNMYSIETKLIYADI